MDGSSSLGGSRAGLLLISPDHYKTSYALHFDFKASNNEAEYEALIADLDLARELGVKAIEVFRDSMLIVNQVTEAFQAKEERMAKYLRKVKSHLYQFRKHTMTQIHRSENYEVDALVQLASRIDTKGLVSIPVEHLQ